MEAFFHCGHSVAKLRSNKYPQQLTVKEVQKMHKMLSNEKYFHWPIVSVAHYAIKRSLIQAHPNTWYKYARLMKIKRKRHKKVHRTYAEGVRADFPNEKWHADITEFETVDGKTSYIYLVVDNFSRYIISWRIADAISAKIRLDTFKDAIQKAGILIDDEQTTELIVDRGTENNNKRVETFIEKYPVEKVVALKDIMQSNSMVESINRTIKYDYLFPRQIRNRTHLKNHFKTFVIPDYNDKRPHGALNGLTPQEAYKHKVVKSKKMRIKMIEAYKERICFNQTNECAGCPFGCKRLGREWPLSKIPNKIPFSYPTELIFSYN
jgi:putative transposase